LLRSLQAAGWSLDLASAADRALFLQVGIKAADVSNPAKKLPLYLDWTDRILEEFYAQAREWQETVRFSFMDWCSRRWGAIPPV